jgi:hypothetical protein
MKNLNNLSDQEIRDLATHAGHAYGHGNQTMKL